VAILSFFMKGHLATFREILIIGSMDQNPHPLSLNEWQEILAVPAVREAWQLQDDATPEELASQVYAAKFNFVSGSPGYVGDLYILQGDHLTDALPMTLMRDKTGNLEIVDYE